MKRLVVASFAALCLASPQMASAAEPQPLPMAAVEDAFERAGLQRGWDTHVQVDAARGRLAEVRLVVDTKRTTTKYVVMYGGSQVTREIEKVVDGEVYTETVSTIVGATREVFSELDRGPRGTAYGIDGARAAADLRVEVLAAEGITANVVEEVSPRITLYGLTDQHILQAIDGETGESLWAARVGPSSSHPLPFHATEDYVVVVNGMQVHCLDALTGTELWNRKTNHAPGSGPTITEWFVYVPMLRGQIEVFPVKRESGLVEPIVFGGRVLQSPVLVGRDMAWINHHDTLFIAPVGLKVEGVEFRVKFDSPLSEYLGTDHKSSLYCSTEDGSFYRISVNQGQLLWKQSLQFKVRRSPIQVGTDIFVVTIDRKLHVINEATGLDRWQAGQVNEFVAATDQHVYAISNTGELKSFNRSTGLLEATIPLPANSFALANELTDRLYIATPQGRVICMHEGTSPRSILHSGETLVPNRDEPTAEPAAPTRPRTPEPAPRNDDASPFGFGR